MTLACDTVEIGIAALGMIAATAGAVLGIALILMLLGAGYALVERWLRL